jgi:coproporphyrinogen III oxidase
MEITKLKTFFWKLKDQITKTFDDFDGAALVSDGWAKPPDSRPEYQIVRIFSSGYKISYHDNNF